MAIIIRPNTVTFLTKLLRPLTDAGAVSMSEEREIIAQLRSLSKTGETIPPVIPKLIDQPTAAEMLGISLANFKKLERNAAFPFKRKQIGTAVRYRNTDIIKFILSKENLPGTDEASES